MKLPKNIIKRYGITRKAWQVFRGTKKNKPEVNILARKRRFGRRASARFIPRRFGRRSRGSKGSDGMSSMLWAFGYGAARGTVANFVRPYSSKLPIPGASDEVGLLLASWGLRKLMPGNSMVRNVTRAVNTIEAASLGNAIMTGRAGFSVGSNGGNGGVIG